MNVKPLNYSHTVESWKEYWARTQSGRYFMNRTIKNRYGEDWKEQFSGSKENIQKFLALNEDEQLKSYMAYQMVTNDDGMSFGNLVNGLLVNVADVGELFSTLTKPALFALDNLVYEKMSDALTPEVADLVRYQLKDNYAMLPVIDKDHKYVGESYADMVKAGFSPTWSETGRRTYDINGYDTLTNLVLEVVSDPEFLISMGINAFTGAAETAVRNVITGAGDDVAKLSGRALNATMRKGVLDGLSNAAIAARIAGRINPDNVEELTKVITNALDYSSAYKLSRSLKTIDDGIIVVEY